MVGDDGLPITFFLDRNSSKRLVPLLASLGIGAIHHDSYFDPETHDDDIISFVAHNALILITFDDRQRFDHRAALVAHAASVFYLSDTIHDMGISGQITWFTTVFPRVVSHPLCQRKGAIIKVLVDGSVREIVF